MHLEFEGHNEHVYSWSYYMTSDPTSHCTLPRFMNTEKRRFGVGINVSRTRERCPHFSGASSLNGRTYVDMHLLLPTKML